MKIKEALRFLFFSLLLTAVVAYMVWVLRSDTSPSALNQVMQYNELYRKVDHWDGIFIGTSTVGKGWVAPLAWKEHGYTIYPMNTDAQPLYLTTNIIEETLKYQDLKLAVVDIRGIRNVTLKPNQAKIRKMVDNFRFSENRIKAVSKSLRMYEKFRTTIDPKMPEISESEAMSYYVPFLKYHSRWQEGLIEADFTKPVSDKKGYFDQSNSVFKNRHIPRTVVTKEVGTLTDIQKEVLDEIIAYGKTNKVKLAFVITPARIKTGIQKEFNAAIEYLKENGYDVLNFNTEEMYDEMGIDFNTDFIDPNHMNMRGAIKFTTLYGKYIAENFDLDDKRGNKDYQSWDEAYDNFKAFHDSVFKKVKSN